MNVSLDSGQILYYIFKDGWEVKMLVGFCGIVTYVLDRNIVVCSSYNPAITFTIGQKPKEKVWAALPSNYVLNHTTTLLLKGWRLH